MSNGAPPCHLSIKYIYSFQSVDLPAKEGNDFPLSEFLKERRVKRRVFKKGSKGKRRHKPKVLSFLEKTHVYFFQNEQKITY